MAIYAWLDGLWCQRDGFPNRELEVDHLGWHAADPPLDCGPSEDAVARFPALSRHELASTLCSHLGWFTPKGRDRLGSCRSPAAVLAPEDALVRLWQRRRRVLNTLVVVLCMFRLVFWKGRPGYAATLAEGWAQRGRWGRMEEGTG